MLEIKKIKTNQAEGLLRFCSSQMIKIHKRKNTLQIEWSLPQQIIYNYVNSITHKLKEKKKKSAESYTFSFIYRRDGDFKYRTTQG